MLVLTRKKDQKIIIGDDITIAVLEIRGDKVRLGIKAPKEIPVHREEIYLAIKKEQESLAKAARLAENDDNDVPRQETSPPRGGPE